MPRLFRGTDEEWDNLITPHHYSGAVLQSSVWARVQQNRGNVCVRIVDSCGAPSLWVSLSISFGISVWYCPRGPFGLPDRDEWKSLVEILQGIKHGSILRIEPPLDFNPDQGELIFSQRRDVSPSHTLITKIDGGQEKIFKTFHEKTRYNIRVAAKHGIVVKKLDATDLKKYSDQVLALYSKTGSRHGIAATPVADMQALFGVCDVWAAFFEDTILATSLHIGFGPTMTYLHGASDYERRSMMAPYALHWAAIQDAMLSGFTMYDWWGIAPPEESTHSLAGVTRFKLGFGGASVESPGTFDAGIDRVRFALYTALQRMRR